MDWEDYYHKVDMKPYLLSQEGKHQLFDTDHYALCQHKSIGLEHKLSD